MAVTDNGRGGPNYFPNSFYGPKEDTSGKSTMHSDPLTGDVERVDTGDDDNFTQCGHFYRNVLSAEERDRLTSNIAGHMVNAAERIRIKAISNFAAADPDYGRIISEKIVKLIRDGNVVERKRTVKPLNPPRSVPPADKPSCPFGFSSRL